MKEIKDIAIQKDVTTMNIPEIRSFFGKLNSIRQIQPNIFQALYEKARKRFFEIGAQYTTKKRKQSMRN